MNANQQMAKTKILTAAFLNQGQTRLTLLDELGIEAVEARMLALSLSDSKDRTGEIITDHLAAGGKRIRARLALMASRTLGVSHENSVTWAAAVEILHNATLVHDDIQDGDGQRRGHPSTWFLHGVPQAINAGDLMLMLPTLALQNLDVSDGTKWKMSHAIAERSASTVRGQSQEMDLLKCRHFDWTNYFTATAGKTGQLLALPIEGAAIMAGWSPSEAQELGEAFVPLGVLYQLQDDVRDIFFEKGRGERGSDIREGKVSALVVAHLELYPNDRPWISDLLALSREQTTTHDIDQVISAFRERGALSQVLDRITNIVDSISLDPTLQKVPELADCAQNIADWLLARVTTNDCVP
jgi:geranylgeranyl pyrophosphate synthase